MLASGEDFVIALVVGLLTGATITAPITYWVMSRSEKLLSLEAFYQGKQAALSEIRMERIPAFTEEGIIRKKYYLVIQERLLHNNLPMSPFWVHKLPLSERLDKDDLVAVTTALTTVADKILGLADLKAMALRRIQSKSGKNPKTEPNN